MPSASATCEPRKMFPPPTTMASSAPSSSASMTWLAVPSRLTGSMPYPPSPARLSPESLSTTRLTGPNLGSMGAVFSPHTGVASSKLRAYSRRLELVTDEPTDDDVLADLLDRLLKEVAHALVRLPDIVLSEEGLFLDELIYPALDDPFDYVLRLAGLSSLLLGDRTLLCKHLLRDILRRD